jgi:uncharacterized protein YkwD
VHIRPRRAPRRRPVRTAAAVLVPLCALGAWAAPPPATAAGAPPPRPAATGIDRASRESVRAAYLNRLRPAHLTPVRWSGSVSRCAAGAPSGATQAATRDAVNYYRAMAQLAPVSFDTALSGPAQKAALMMDANDALSHDPPSSWRCWSDDGAAAAGRSNLALGSGGAAAVSLYMADPGPGNTMVGHRRWILHAPTRSMGSGSTPTAHALTVFGGETATAGAPAWVPWPTPGYFPAEIEPDGLWSLSSNLPAVDLRRTSVTVTSAGRKLPVRRYSVVSGYGPETVSWYVKGVRAPSGSGVASYRVTVHGIRVDGRERSHSYLVRLFDADPRS